MEYDILHRPISFYVTGADTENTQRELLVEHLIYGETLSEAEGDYLRGKLYLHLDQAGMVINNLYDFKGNLKQSSRLLAKDYKQTQDWNEAKAILSASLESLEQSLSTWLETEMFTSRTSFDALNRPIQMNVPHSSLSDQNYHVIQPVYNEANLLEKIDVWLSLASQPNDLLESRTLNPSLVGVHNIDYDAKGQRTRIDYKNGTSTRYQYDPNTFQLTHLYTRRGPEFNEDCENPNPPPPDIAAPNEPPTTRSCGLQNLHYFYDPVGNITYIRDDAQQKIFFRNRAIEPSTDYTYDALYRLTVATGREHLGQTRKPQPHSHNDEGRMGINLSANDGTAMGTYNESYIYDAVGNILSMQHRGSDSANQGWRREYTYQERSSIEEGLYSNRLTSTTLKDSNGPNPTITEAYRHDSHGNMTRMPHLYNYDDPLAANMHWDYRDQLQQTDIGDGGVAYFVYGADGQRVRKIWRKTQDLIEERIYFGGFEIFRKRNRQNEVTLERETVHIMDDQQRIALVERRTKGEDPGPQQLIKYQLNNHLGSSIIEVNENADIISYEEYSPYGSTTVQAVRNQTETSKRYGYTGKERDHESSFYYYGARYYAPWLGRWTSCDPSGIKDSNSLYVYVKCNPIKYVDPNGKDAAAIAEGILAWIGADTAVPDPSDAVWFKWAGYAILGVAATATIALAPKRTSPGPLIPRGPYPPPTRPPSTPNPTPAPPPPIPGPLPIPVPPVPVPVPVPLPIPMPSPNPNSQHEPSEDRNPSPNQTTDPIPHVDDDRRKGKQKYYVTYTVTNKKTGEVYAGRTSGYGDPRSIMAARFKQHKKERIIGQGFDSLELDRALPANPLLPQDCPAPL